MSTTSLSFTNGAGLRLSAALDEPTEQPPLGYAVFAHCFSCSKDYKAPVRVSRGLAALGMATLRFDFPGLGKSQGQFKETTLSGNASDVVYASRFLAERAAPPAVLIGHSMGGAAVLRAAALLDHVRLVVTLGAPARPASESPTFLQARAEAEVRGLAELEIAGRKLELDQAFFRDLDRHPLLETVARLPQSLLVFHSPCDEVVPFADAERIFRAAPGPKSFVSLEGADHMLSRRADTELVAAVVGAWCRRYLGPARAGAP